MFYSYSGRGTVWRSFPPDSRCSVDHKAVVHRMSTRSFKDLHNDIVKGEAPTTTFVVVVLKHRGTELHQRFPDLHVFSYGTLPCVDKTIAEASSHFVTSIVYNDEFSARLSVNSIIRLRAAAMTALSDKPADSTAIHKLARRILHADKPQESRENNVVPVISSRSANLVVESESQKLRRKHIKYTVKGGVFVCNHAFTCMVNMPSHSSCTTMKNDAHESLSGISIESNGIFDKRGCELAAGSGGHEFPYPESTCLVSGHCAEVSEDGVAEFNTEDVFEHVDSSDRDLQHLSKPDDFVAFEDRLSLENATSSSQVQLEETSEMFLPGLIIHIVPERRSIVPLWNSWWIQDGKHGHQAFLTNRENFKDIIVTPYMFLDHLPWRCHYAMQKVLETRAKCQLDADLVNRNHHIV